jgi:Ran GTPase-activating protein (RanGAP) involved in mRNA processing and transport
VLLLGDNRIGDEGMGLVSPAVRGCERLKQLDLGSNQITEEGAVALAGCLPFLTCLEHLNLSGNPLGRRGVAIIAKAISSLPSLKTFHVKDAFEYKSEVVKMVSVADTLTS